MAKLNIRTKTKVKSKKTKSILLYVFFVFVSAVFWCFITLNKTVQQDLTFELHITDIPQGVTLIDELPTTINVTLKDKGSAFVRPILFGNPQITIKFSDFSNSLTGHFKLNTVQLRNAIKKKINREAIIVSILPNEIDVKYTVLPGKKVPIRYDLRVEPNLQYVLNGAPVLSQDSVMVYGDRVTLAEINEVYTYLVQESNLTDTLRREMTIQKIKNARIIPETVTITVPIEQLIAKKKTVDITIRNLPDNNVKIALYPLRVEASYLIPKSLYKRNDNDITAIVDYNSIDWAAKTSKVEVIVGEAPAIYKNIEITPDSVEFWLEKQ